MQLTRYGDFEGVMAEVAAEQRWTFCDGDEPVAAETVFNDQTYGPAILKLAMDELDSRDLTAPLGIQFSVAADALLGMSVSFDPEQNSLLAASWRICVASYVVGQLPRLGSDFDLSLLRHVFAQEPTPDGATA